MMFRVIQSLLLFLVGGTAAFVVVPTFTHLIVPITNNKKIRPQSPTAMLALSKEQDLAGRRRRQSIFPTSLSSLCMADGDSDTADAADGGENEDPTAAAAVATLDQPDGVEEGTHEELMYTLGVNLARQLGDVRPLVEDGQELAQVAKGLLDTVIGRLNEEGQKQLLLRRGGELNQLITDRANKIKDTLEKAGREMLATMAQTEGAVTLPSGVVLHVLEDGPEGKGQGVRPTKSSTVKIHYHGTLADGTVFDSTLSGEPVKFPLAGVIPGWSEGVQKMHEGETAMLGIPPELGYGEKGTPDGSIPGGSTLFFKVQLLEVLSAGIGGGPTLLGADGQKMKKEASGGLLGADGKPLA